ncbi:MAG: hypothetical protein VW443_07975 [Pseudomonadales bacterium]
MPTISFRGITAFSDQRENAEVVNNILQGKLNATASVTLTNSATSTAVTDYRVGAESVILFMPTTSDGASELAAGGMYVSARSKNTFTITHANNTTTRSFDYVVIG